MTYSFEIKIRISLYPENSWLKQMCPGYALKTYNFARILIAPNLQVSVLFNTD